MAREGIGVSEAGQWPRDPERSTGGRASAPLAARPRACRASCRAATEGAKNAALLGRGAGNRTPRRDGESTRIYGNGGEPTGTGEGSISRRFPLVDAEHDARHTIDAAREYLSAGARGNECGHLAMKLASAVLSREDVRLAFEVLAGGPFCHARATELASRVLGRPREDVAVEQVTERVREGA
jgi:hypothetical protein